MRAKASTMQMPSMANMALRQAPMQRRRAGLPSPSMALPNIALPSLPNVGGGGGDRKVGKGGRLSAAERKALPDSAFAGPNRSFPVNDKNHARAALSMIGNAPPAARAKIKARANAKLGKASSKPTGKGGGAGKHPVGCGCGNH